MVRSTLGKVALLTVVVSWGMLAGAPADGKPRKCALRDARFLTVDGPLFEPAPFGYPADVIELAGEQVSVKSSTSSQVTCAREPVAIVGRRRRRIEASCAGASLSVRFAPRCRKIRGRFTATDGTVHRFVAAPSVCGDGRTDVSHGEECDRTGCNSSLQCSDRCGCTDPTTPIDRAFGVDGIAGLALETGEEPSALAVRSDGRILVGFRDPNGSNRGLLRLMQDGSVDTSFGDHGRELLVAASSVRTIHPMSDGRILLTAFGNDVGLLRLQSDGALDPTFGNQGLVLARRLVDSSVAPDGTILVADGDFGLLRYHADGTRDTLYGRRGFPYPPGSTVSKVYFASDGSVVMGGGENDLRRFLPDGSQDDDFGTAGRLSLKDPGGVGALGVSALAGGVDGEFFVLAANLNLRPVGSTTRFVRVDSRGTLLGDIEAPIEPLALATLPDRRILMAGVAVVSEVAVAHVELARYQPDGILDDSFGRDGVMATPLFGSSRSVILAPEPDGSVLVLAGQALVRILP